MTLPEKAFYKAYMQGYFAGYRDARTDIKNGINQLTIESDLLSQPIETMALSTRASNSLAQAGFCYVGDITKLSDSQIIAIRKLGAKSRAEIANWLDKNGITNTAWHLFL